MTSVIKYYEGIDSVAVIGNYLPRQCGIATFTTDLVDGLSAEAPDIYCWAVAMNDKPEGYPYPEKVRFEINQNKLADYSVAAQFLNITQTDIQLTGEASEVTADILTTTPYSGWAVFDSPGSGKGLRA